MLKNKTIGSMLIVAGTTIGAGMLALPIASAGLGFTTALALIISIWALMTYTALLMLELHQHADRDATLNTLAKSWLGKRGQYLANFSVMFLFYALCSAYIAGGGAQLQEKINNGFSLDIAPQVGSIILAIVIGTVVTLGTSKVDKLNRVLFSIKIVVLASLFYMLTPYVHGQHLLEMPIEQGLILSAIPVVFTSFGFHGSIPSIVKYVGLDIKTLRRVMIAGAALPLVIYIFWQLISQGMMSQAELLKSSGLPGFVASIASIANNAAVATAVNLFADLALATSFLGVSLGLFDFFADAFKKGDGNKDRIKTALITFIPPLGFALFYPQGFIMALGYAAIALVVLAVFLPVAMVYKQRSSDKGGYTVRGGNFGLAVAALCGVLIISAQGMQMAGLIPAIG
ncbi:aromatic amino acid transport family protein [Pseudoalteromonas sp. SR41-4]|uniref:aromatic amino acid transport family protein n=1 Tax=Pseudoalteromonas sp. SR41-4 TaxID=2760950 RepID=UPI0016002FF1|nr:aromatic amino acid transport family protein [Pseudoalteromonas sp. SR41-4]MBB1295116.1 amino acid permease [Pseudoalteromonas sp. SR41-4]